MDSISFKQAKPFKVKIFGAVLIIIAFYSAIFEDLLDIKTLIVFVLGLSFISYSVIYEVDKDFNIYRCLRFFRINLTKKSLNLNYPDYIVVMPAFLKQSNDWSTVSALGTEVNNESITIKIFSEREHFTLFHNQDYKLALGKAKQLGSLLNIEVKDKVKKGST